MLQYKSTRCYTHTLMGEMPKIQGGHNRYDPLRDYFEQATLPKAQIPEVQARCYDVWQDALTLCLRTPNQETTIDDFDHVSIETQPFVYEPPTTRTDGETLRGQILLRAEFPLTDSDDIDFQKTEVSICHETFEGSGIYQAVITLYRDEVWLATDAGARAGNHSELNYFNNVLTKMREAVFPKTPVAK